MAWEVFPFCLILVFTIQYLDAQNRVSPNQYKGCFNYDNDNLAFPKQIQFPQAGQPSQCITECHRLEFSYTGIYNGDKCACTNAYSMLQGADNQCNLPCTSDSNFYCGGSNAIDVYSVCQDHRYGSNCQNICGHCKNGTLCDYVTGNCPLGGCEVTYKGPQCWDAACYQPKCMPQFKGSCSFNSTGPGYICHCPVGFYSTNLQGCNDINECESLFGICAEGSDCKNTLGSYRCECASGYTLIGGTCQDVDECAHAVKFNYSKCGYIGQERPICKNTPGGYECECNKKGYTTQTNLQGCVDINECAKPNICGYNSSCTNKPGSYTCNCFTGFTINEDQTECVDINECLDADKCGPSAKCVNHVGAYSCTCPDGYEGNPPTSPCQDKNECIDEPCGQNGVCTNSAGTFACECKDGYTLVDNSRCVTVCASKFRMLHGAHVGWKPECTSLPTNQRINHTTINSCLESACKVDANVIGYKHGLCELYSCSKTEEIEYRDSPGWDIYGKEGSIAMDGGGSVNTGTIVAIAVVLVIALIIVAGLVFYIVRQKEKKVKDTTVYLNSNPRQSKM